MTPPEARERVGAPHGRRILAAAIDFFLVSGGITAALAVLRLAANRFAPPAYEDAWPESNAHLLGTALTEAAVYWLYFTLLEASERQATVGQRALRLRVVGETGARVSRRRAAARALARLLLAPGVLAALRDARRRTLHDAVTRTWVIADER